MSSKVIFHSSKCPRCNVLEKKLKEKGIEYEENNLFDGADAVRVSARRRDVGLCAGTDSALDFGIFTERHFGAFHGHLLSGGGERDGD